MTPETISPQELLEAQIGKEGMRTLDQIGDMLYAGGKGTLSIKDLTLVNTAIEQIKQCTNIRREHFLKPPINFVEVDFRKKGSNAWLKELAILIGDLDSYGYESSGKTSEKRQRAQEHRESTRLIFINPTADPDNCKGMNLMNLYVKYGIPALTILPAVKFKGLQPLIKELIAEYSDHFFYLGSHPDIKD